jgi:transketolase N-terminal domain/subunit
VTHRPKVPPQANKFNLSTAELKEMAKKLRRHVITMIATAGSGHPGGSLSAADIITALYFKVLRHNPKHPQWQTVTDSY